MDGGILRLDRRPSPLIPPNRRADWTRLIDYGFTGRGGSLPASLAAGYGPRRAHAACRAVRLSPSTLVSEVWPEQWLTLFRLLT